MFNDLRRALYIIHNLPSDSGLRNIVAMDPILIRAAKPDDLSQLAELCHSLWPDAAPAEHASDLSPLLAGKPVGSLPAAIFVAEDARGSLVGFVEAGLRSHADGCDPSLPVGFIEGWYVAPELRRRKIGTQLIRAAEEWAREQGCVEMASDSWLDATVSLRAHQALGFEIVDRCVHYRKRL